MSLRRALVTLACSTLGHRFVVWVRSGAEASRHPHLGAWARCARCAEERDWLFAGTHPDDEVRDEVHGVVRPLRDVLAIARGLTQPEALDAPLPRIESPARAGRISRPLRRGGSSSRSGRVSTRLGPDEGTAPSEHDPRG